MSMNIGNVVEFTAPHSKVNLVKNRVIGPTGEFDFSRIIPIPKGFKGSLPDWAEKSWGTRFNSFNTYYDDNLMLCDFSEEHENDNNVLEVFRVSFMTDRTPPIRAIKEMSRIYGVRANLMWTGEDTSILGEIQFDEKGNEVFSINMDPDSITATILYNYIWDNIDKHLQ